MSGTEQPIGRQVQEWLAKADSDLAAAEALVRDGGAHADHICFLAQQAAEKTVKAVLLAVHARIPRTHDLSFLIDLVDAAERELARALRPLEALTPYAAGLRYPSYMPPAKASEAVTALQLARAARAMARERLGA